MNLDSLTIGLIVAVTLMAAGYGAGWFAHAAYLRRKPVDLRFIHVPPPSAAAPQPFGPLPAPVAIGAVVSSPTTRIPPAVPRTPEMPARVAPDRLRPATVPPAPKPRIRPKPQQRGRHWPADIKHTGAIPTVQKETAS